MNYEATRAKYVAAARKHCDNWKATPSDHIIDVIVSVMLTRDKILPGGSFVQSIIDNDLSSAVSRADSDCINHLKLIVLAKSQAYIDAN